MLKGACKTASAAAANRRAVRASRRPTLSTVVLAEVAPVLVEPPVYYGFEGAIDREVAQALWAWIERDVAPEETERASAAHAAGATDRATADMVLDPVLARLKTMLAEEAERPDIMRRNTIQMGGDEPRARLAHFITAIRRRQVLAQGAQFGRALGALGDDKAIVTALESVDIKNPVIRALWMQASVTGMANPGKVMAAVTSLRGQTEPQLVQAGYAPLVEAMLAHAQNQLAALMEQPGVFADFDLACRAVTRFHRLMRAINANTEIPRDSAWGGIILDLTRRTSERLDGPLRQINADVTQALRRPREGADRVDPDRVLSALNGLFLLNSVRNARDSLALNAVLDQVWTETGQALEILTSRALDMLRAAPADLVARDRIDAAIKMARVRFGTEYADTLDRARDSVSKRAAS